MQLGKNVFLAIAATGVASSTQRNPEDGVEALVGEAASCGLRGADLDEVKDVARSAHASPGKLDDRVKGLTLTPEERLLAYSLAAWLVRVDGIVMPEEKMALHRFGDFLRLADGDRTRASAASFKVSQLPLEAGGRPGKFDLAALADRIKDDLAAPLPSGS